MKPSKKLLIPALFLAHPAFSAPFSTIDARSMAMGDTGVASSNPGSAGLFNSALLSNYDDDENLHIVLPNIGIGIFADPDALDAVTDIEDNGYVDNISDSLDIMNDPVDDQQFLSAKDIFVNNASGFNDDLSKLSEQPFRINTGAFAAVSIPNKFIGVSVFANANAIVETAPIITNCDNEILDGYIDYMGAINTEQDIIDSVISNDPSTTVECSNGITSVEMVSITATDPNTGLPTAAEITDPTDELTSHVVIAGVTIVELGVALSHEFEIMGQDISFGVTPKLMQITSYYAAPSVQTLDQDDYDLGDELEDSEKDEDDFNLDLGIASNFLADESLTVGLTIKNLLSNSYKTSDFILPDGSTTNATFDIDTQVRAGASWAAPLGLTLTADLDLTKNKPYFLGEDTQFLGLGVEWDVLSVIRLRGGYRSNLADSDDKVLTAGVGFNIIAFYVDLGIQASENNAGGALQLGLAF